MLNEVFSLNCSTMTFRQSSLNLFYLETVVERWMKTWWILDVTEIENCCWHNSCSFVRLDPVWSLEFGEKIPMLSKLRKWSNIRLALKTLTSSIMINELFIKISGYKTLQHFSLSVVPLPPRSWQSIKHFYVWKIWKWMKNSKIFATQFLFYAMLFEWYENIRFRLYQSSSPAPVRVCFECTMWIKYVVEGKNPLSMFSIDFPLLFSLTDSSWQGKMNYFPYIE